MISILKCEDLAIGYNNDIVLNDINFELFEGEYLYIIGDNGIGKSTLLNTILGLNNPVKGKVFLDTKNIGYLPQQKSIQGEFPATVMEIVMSAFLNQKKLTFWYKKEEKETALRVLEELDILDLKKSSFKTLSGGQKQRVLLARALCSTDKILFLDEPNSGLDPETTLEFYNIIAMLNKEKKLTIVMVSHDIETLPKYATKVLCLQKNKAFFGTLSEYQSYIGGESNGTI